MASVATIELLSESAPDALSDDTTYEVIGGKSVGRPEMGTYPVEVASILLEQLGPFVRRQGIGRAIVEILIRIDDSTQYRPDLAYISHEKWPIQRRTPRRQPWEIVPDVAIEVISETDRAGNVLAKTHHYLKVGIRAVWLVYPELEVIHIFHSPTRIEVLTRESVLDGGEIIPGFQLPLSTLFAGETSDDSTEFSAH